MIIIYLFDYTWYIVFYFYIILVILMKNEKKVEIPIVGIYLIT
jgi:hypothetical protein